MKLGTLTQKVGTFLPDLPVLVEWRKENYGDEPGPKTLSSPVGLDSYRGFYDQLAIGHGESNLVTVSDLYKMLCDADGATFHGYKGGEFVMDDMTTVWVDNDGECNSNQVVDVEEVGGAVIIKTAVVDLW